MDEALDRYAGSNTCLGQTVTLMAYVSRAVERWQPWVITVFFVRRNGAVVAPAFVKRTGRGADSLWVATSEMQKAVNEWRVEANLVNCVDLFESLFPDSDIVDHTPRS